MSLVNRLTWMLFGTPLCGSRRCPASTHVSFTTNRHPASRPLRQLLVWRCSMQIVHAQCAGLDVHKKPVVGCCRSAQPAGPPTSHIRSSSTMTVGLLALVDCLLNCGITHVAMETTGEFCKPVYNLL